MKFDGDMDPFIETDKIKFRQILLNLGNNAFKYTPQGQVTVTISKRSMAGFTDPLVIEIQDTGAGISEAHQVHLFEPFQRHENFEESSEGVGLGLSIAKGLAKVLGGDLILKESCVGKGSTFMVFIPVRWLQKLE